MTETKGERRQRQQERRRYGMRVKGKGQAVMYRDAILKRLHDIEGKKRARSN